MVDTSSNTRRTLASAVEARNVIFVIGTGVSAGASDGARVAMWRGLIEDGIEKCFSLALPGADDKWRTTCYGLLDVGAESNDTSLMISAASQVSLKLKTSPQAYSDWLRDSVGTLPRVDTSVIDALRNSGFPILTTNYDTLIEGQDGTAASWQDPLAIQSIMACESNSVGHLHGVWTDPTSIVLSEADYRTQALSAGVQALQRAAASVKTLVYIGYGSGLEDPNFSELLNWQRTTFNGATHQHYRLSLNSELADLRQVHKDDNIIVEAYGDKHSDLAEFLGVLLADTRQAALTPAGKIRDCVAEAKSEFEETLKTHAVVIFPMTGEPEGHAPIVPPPLLPVPYAQYVEHRSDKNDVSAIGERLEALDVARRPGITVVASEEGGGLTTALRWLALRASELIPGLIPVYLPFNQCSNRHTPILSALRPHLRARGLLSASSDLLPPIILVLDDVHGNGKAAGTALRELVQHEFSQVFIGCRVGSEEGILSVLRAAGASPAVQYLGRFESKEVTELITAVAPGQVQHLFDRVVDAFVRTNLPRTPMTVASIIYILMHGTDSVIPSSASQSSILEQYVSILLGQGNPLEDARLGIEAGGRVSVLASLAERLVEENTQVLDEPATIARFATHFELVGWKESETRLLESFIERGILRRTEKGIEFHHNSFVYLFAAKRAITHSSFLDTLLTRPIHYSRVIQVHAGLARSDARSLRSLIERYTEKLTQIGHEPGPAYAPIRVQNLPEEFQDDDPGESDPYIVETDDAEPDSTYGLTPLDYPEPLIPLFNNDVDLPLLGELARILETVSGVLRDADQIEDAELKRHALRVVLGGWGNFISALSHVISSNDLVNVISTSLETTTGQRLTEDDKEQVVELLERVLPVGTAMGGITFTLKSRTLVRPLEHEMAQGDFDSPELLVAAALLILSLKERGWASQIVDLMRRSPNHAVWSDFFRFDLQQCYFSDEEDDEDRAAALEGVVEIRARSRHFSSAAATNSFKEDVRKDMRKKRLQRETKAKLSLTR